MTEEQAIEELRELKDSGDIEDNHIRADHILCCLLSSNGFTNVVEEFKRIEKWYA